MRVYPGSGLRVAGWRIAVEVQCSLLRGFLGLAMASAKICCQQAYDEAQDEAADARSEKLDQQEHFQYSGIGSYPAVAPGETLVVDLLCYESV